MGLPDALSVCWGFGPASREIVVLIMVILKFTNHKNSKARIRTMFSFKDFKRGSVSSGGTLGSAACISTGFSLKKWLGIKSLIKGQTEATELGTPGPEFLPQPSYAP